MKIGNKVIDYSVYGRIRGANRFIADTKDVQLPEIEMLTDTIKGAGILGEVDMPSLNQVGAMMLAMNLRNCQRDSISLFGQKAQDIEIRYLVDKYDTSRAITTTEAHKVFVKGIPKKFTLGKIEKNATQDASIELEVVYYNHIIDGVSVIEVDKFNNVLKIDGIDYTKSLRDAL